MNNKITFNDLQLILKENCTIYGNKELLFNGVNTIYDSVNGDISWVKPGVKDEYKLINETKASCIVCSNETYKKFNQQSENKLFIISEDPKLIFVKILKFLEELFNKDNIDDNVSLIHPSAIIHPKCIIGNNVKIGAFSIIDECEIGDGTIVGTNVRLFNKVKIGKNCIIREFCSIGGQGFGFYRENNSVLFQHIPHVGSVIIEDNVHIYPYVNIDLGTIGSTIIGYNTIIDHFVHIGHNAKIGKCNIIAAKTVLSGGVKIGNNTFLGVGSLIKEKCEIGSGVVIGIGSVVIKDIPDNQLWYGNPAKKSKDLSEKYKIFGL
jgi:UDP-3-O-[3-hydroxymyristoyl] glucosamine N-acyltransferase